MKKTKVFAGLIMLISMIWLVGCSQTSSTPSDAEKKDGNVAAVEEVKEYIVGTDAAYAPFEFVDTQTEIVGFDIDLMKAIAEKGGFKVKVVNTPWEGIFNSLKQGDRDILISAITITEERKKEMDFSDPYFESQQLIAIPQSSTVAKFEDLKGKKVGVQTGTTGDEVVTGFLGNNYSDLVRFESTPLALKELTDGGVEAVVADYGVVLNYLNNNSNDQLKVVSDDSFEKEFYGIAVKKGNQELLDKINIGLFKIKEDGTFKKIEDKYFGTK